MKIIDKFSRLAKTYIKSKSLLYIHTHAHYGEKIYRKIEGLKK